MELCGAGCMGFANVTYGLRAMGYVEPDPLPAGPIALVTHSGSVFSALLRTRRAFGFTLAVSSGQELVTAAPSYLDYALAQPETKVLALVLEAMREPDKLRAVLDQRRRTRHARHPAHRRPTRQAAARWWPRTRARWPAPTAAGRRWPATTAFTGSATWPN